jgi:hypothetical protein
LGDAHDRVSLGNRTIIAQVGDDHSTGVDPDPDVGRHAEPAVQIGTGIPHCHDQVKSRKHRPTRIILVRFGISKTGEDSIAGILHYLTPVPLDCLSRRCSVGREKITQLLGFHALGQHRRTHDVGEHEGHECPLPGRLERSSKHPLQNEGGTPVVRIDGTHLFGSGTRWLEIARRQRGLRSIQQSFE